MLYQSDWSDYWIAVALALAFTGLRLIESRWVLTPLATRVFGLKASDRSVAKFNEAAWKLQVWLPLFILGFSISYSHDWFFNSRKLFDSWPNPMSWWLRAYYLIELGWYGHAQLTLVFFETETGKNRSDFWPMTVHHCATVVLISFSYLNGYTPIGAMIMWVHDIVDIPLEAALLLKEIGAQFWCDVCFVFFAVFWIIFRLGVFPLHLVWQAVFVDLIDTCPKRAGHPMIGKVQYLYQIAFNLEHSQDELDPSMCKYTRFLSTFVVVLCVLHVYWFALIARMIRRFVFDKHVAGDIRDDAVDGRSDAGASAKGAQTGGATKRGAKQE